MFKRLGSSPEGFPFWEIISGGLLLRGSGTTATFCLVIPYDAKVSCDSEDGKKELGGEGRGPLWRPECLLGSLGSLEFLDESSSESSRVSFSIHTRKRSSVCRCITAKRVMASSRTFPMLFRSQAAPLSSRPWIWLVTPEDPSARPKPALKTLRPFDKNHFRTFFFFMPGLEFMWIYSRMRMGGEKKKSCNAENILLNIKNHRR